MSVDDDLGWIDVKSRLSWLIPPILAAVGAYVGVHIAMRWNQKYRDESLGVLKAWSDAERDPDDWWKNGGKPPA